MSDENSVSTSTKSKKMMFSSVRNISFGRSRAYLFEYGLLLVLTLALLNILGMMFQELIGKQASFIQNSFYLPVLPYGFTDMTIGLFSAFLVVFPAVIILIQRTASAERVDPNIKNIGWRKGLLNLFLAISAVWAIVGLVAVLTAGLNYLSLMGVTDTTFDWREASENLFRAVFLLLAVWAFSSDYRNVKVSYTPKVMHAYRYTLVLAGAAVGVLFAIFPFMDNRKQVVDGFISGDLYSIQNQINSKYYENYELPDSIDSLKLNDQEKTRASKHGYKYEKTDTNKYKLCANFLSDSSDENKAYPATDIAIYPPYYNGDFYSHGEGEKCFDLSIDDYGYLGGSSESKNSIDYSEPTTLEAEDLMIKPESLELLH